jgi:hypothetical protein
MERRRCRYCGKPMLMATTVAGRLMPLDPEPDPVGGVVLERARNESGDELGARRARVLKKGEFVAPGAERYRTHFSTCPNYPRRRKSDAPVERREPYAEERELP